MAIRARWHNGQILSSDIPSSWWQAQTKLAKRDYLYLGGGRQTKTWLVRYDPPNTDFAILLEHTNVVTFHQDGEITLNSGGWKTKTTKQRINEALPIGWAVWSRGFRKNGRYRSEWWLYFYGNPVMEFEDGMRFDPDNIEPRN